MFDDTTTYGLHTFARKFSRSPYFAPGAAGHELNETASVLSERVNEVSTSIEQMVKSVRQVRDNAEALGEASVETSSSMEEMATSMREVDESAEETARLSRQMVESAESGQQKMVQTIQGMEAIRDAARSSKTALRAVGARTLVGSADLLPFALSGLAARLYGRLALARRVRPMFNLVITNVPGPPRRLTIGGAELLAHVGAAPVADGLGLILKC